MATVSTLRRLVSKSSSEDLETSLRRVSASAEHDRILIVISTINAVAYIVYAFVTLPVMVAEADGVVARWYPAVGTVLVFGPGLALLGVRWATDPQRRALLIGIVCPLGAVAGAAVWAAAGVADAAEPAVWMLDFAGVPAVAVAAVRPMREAFAVLVVCKGSAAYVAVVHCPGADVGAMAGEAVFGILFTSLFVYMTAMVVRAGASLDESRSATADLVAASVRNAELARFDGLIHDHVISTLAAAVADPRDPRVVDLASSALTRLDALADADDADGEPISDVELVARVRTAIGPTVETIVRTDLNDARAFPPSMARAASEAVGEAVRNARLHAGANADVVVAIDVSDDQVSVVVADDGVGFDPSAVANDRLGLRLSVGQRMRSVDGGRSRVRSSSGEGTTVEIEWTRP